MIWLPRVASQIPSWRSRSTWTVPRWPGEPSHLLPVKSCQTFAVSWCLVGKLYSKNTSFGHQTWKTWKSTVLRAQTIYKCLNYIPVFDCQIVYIHYRCNVSQCFSLLADDLLTLQISWTVPVTPKSAPSHEFSASWATVALCPFRTCSPRPKKSMKENTTIDHLNISEWFWTDCGRYFFGFRPADCICHVCRDPRRRRALT